MRNLLLLALLLPLHAGAAEQSPAEAVSAMWRAISNDAGAAADVASLKRLFHEDAVVFGGRYKDGSPVLRRSMAADFLKAFERPGEQGFYECETTRSLQVYDHFAVAFSVVESRTNKSASAPDFVGVNSIQLYKVGEQWKVLSLYYHVEKPGLAIALDGGQSGKCLP